jgi:hypothetical protein
VIEDVPTKEVIAMRLLTWATLVTLLALLSSSGVAGSAPTAPRLANARLAGDFDVTTRVVSASGANVHKGSTDSGSWRFTPACTTGACSTRLRYEYRGASFDEHTARIQLKKAGAIYTGSAKSPLLECNFKDVFGTLTVRLEATTGAWINGRWRVTKVAGKYDYDAPVTISGIYRCPAAHITATVRGTLDQ